MLSPELFHYNDPEGNCLPSGISCVIDAHVHVFLGKANAECGAVIQA